VFVVVVYSPLHRQHHQHICLHFHHSPHRLISVCLYYRLIFHRALIFLFLLPLFVPSLHNWTHLSMCEVLQFNPCLLLDVCDR
jgi:hypothetical protein